MPSHAKAVYADDGSTGSGQVASGSGSDLRSSSATMPSLEDFRRSQGSHGLQTDSRRVGPEQVPSHSFLQDDEPYVTEHANAFSILDGKSRSEGRLPPCANQAQPAQVPCSNVLGEAILLSGSSVRLGDSSLAVLDSNRGSFGASQGHGSQHLGVLRRHCHVEQVQGRATSPGPRGGLPLRKVGAYSKREEITSFSHLISRLGRGSLGLSRRHVVPAKGYSRQHPKASHSSSGDQAGLQKAVGIPVRSRCLRSSDKPKSQALQPSDKSDKALRLDPTKGQGGKAPSLLSRSAVSMDKVGFLDSARTLCSSPFSIPNLDRRVKCGVGGPKRTRTVLEGKVVDGTKCSAHQCKGTSDHSASALNLEPKESDASSLVRQSNCNCVDPETGFSLSRLAEVDGSDPADLRGKRASHKTQAHQGILERSSRCSLERAGITRGMGIEYGDVQQSCQPTRLTASGRPVRLSTQPQTPGILLSVPVSQGLGDRCSSSRLEQLQPSSNLSSSRSRKGSGQEASLLRGGGILILPDSPALMHLIPTRLLSKELSMDPPFQQLVERVILASEGYEHFRAWSF